MTAKEIRELSLQELDKKLRDMQAELLQMRLRKQTGQVENTGRFRELRRDIARILTTINAKQKAARATASA
jgi:large subunit ribosomal protein L29